jgi:hypothetical protein
MAGTEHPVLPGKSGPCEGATNGDPARTVTRSVASGCEKRDAHGIEVIANWDKVEGCGRR